MSESDPYAKIRRMTEAVQEATQKFNRVQHRMASTPSVEKAEYFPGKDWKLEEYRIQTSLLELLAESALRQEGILLDIRQMLWDSGSAPDGGGSGS